MPLRPCGTPSKHALPPARHTLQLHKEGWLQPMPEGEPSNIVQLRNPQDPKQEGPVMVAGACCTGACAYARTTGTSRAGWLRWQPPTRTRPRPLASRSRPIAPRVRAGRDASEADVDYFLCAVKILQHQGPLSSSFPVENRLVPQARGGGG